MSECIWLFIFNKRLMFLQGLRILKKKYDTYLSIATIFYVTKATFSQN